MTSPPSFLLAPLILPPALHDGREVFLRLLSGGGQSSAGNPAALHALMPLLTMKPAGNKSGMPTDARSRTAAHNKAVQVGDSMGH